MIAPLFSRVAVTTHLVDHLAKDFKNIIEIPSWNERQQVAADTDRPFSLSPATEFPFLFLFFQKILEHKLLWR